MPPILNAQGLSKQFGAVPLFQNISFPVSDGDRIGLIGPNGAGKSTLLAVLAGEQEVNSGDVATRKRMFEDFTDAARAAREADARRDSIFAQSVDAQKNKDDLMAKKFAEAVKKAKEKPLTDSPLRDFDLD